MALSNHKTKIVATIGPACDEPAQLEAMIQAGMNVARLNFSHGTFDAHAQQITKLRTAAEVVGCEIAVMADLPGPKMRIGALEQEPIELEAGESFTLVKGEITGDHTRASTTFPRLAEVVKTGDKLFLNDGIINLEVVRVEAGDVHCRILVGGELRSRKGLNLPGIQLGMSAFTERDRDCLRFAIEHGVDAVSQSFVESAADVEAVREACRSFGGQPLVLAKIERAGALDHIDEILKAADGIMIARGDLGVEVPFERIAILQKTLIQKARREAKPVITATQMLESMTHARQPTRAEATDVANAILDGTDCVMLSGESATGRFPVHAVETLARIAVATEPHRSRSDILKRVQAAIADLQLDPPDLFAVSVETLMACSKPAAVVVPTRSGTTARRIGRLRLPVWVAAPTSHLHTSRHLQFSYGVEPILVDPPVDDWSAYGKGWIQEQRLAGRLAILIRGPSPRNPNANHSLEILDLGANFPAE